jgi:hypothetical protein
MVQVQTTSLLAVPSPNRKPIDLSLFTDSSRVCTTHQQMRASSRLAAAAGFLLMLLMTAMEAEAIRMDAESRAAVSRQMVAVNVSVFPP